MAVRRFIRTSTMTSTDLSADCARCAALCCVALAFDRSPLFAFDKAAGEPCENLGPRGRCRIHAERAATGFVGCAAYDCLGAGQAVTQDMFAGASWQDDPALLAPMMRAFAVMRPAREALGLLRQAGRMTLPEGMEQDLAALERTLDPQEGWSLADVRSGRIERATEAARAFLRSLAPLLESGATRAGARRRCGP